MESDPEGVARACTGRRRLLLAAAAAVLVLCGAMLAVTAQESLVERRFASLWRFRDVLMTAAALWIAAALVAAASSRRSLRRLLSVSAVAGATLLLMELAGVLRIVDYPALLGNAPGEALGSRALPNVDLRGTTWQDTALAWGLASEPIPFRYTTDRRGYRNAADLGAADVVLLGDSCLVAALLPFEDTLCARLERSLGRPVVNVALIGIGVQQECDLLRRSALPLRDRLVLHFVFEGNDQADSAAWRAREGSRPARRSGAEGTLTHSALIALERALQPVHPVSRVRTGTIGGQPYTFYWTAETYRGREGEIPHILAALDETRRHVESQGGVYGVVVIPDKLRILGPLCEWPPRSELADYRAHWSPLPDAVEDWSRRTGVPTLDLTAALRRAADSGRIPWFPADTHWNATGHEVAGAEVVRWISDHRLLPSH